MNDTYNLITAANLDKQSSTDVCRKMAAGCGGIQLGGFSTAAGCRMLI